MEETGTSEIERRRKMDRKIVLLVCVFVLGISGLAFAATCGSGCDDNSGHQQLAQANTAKQEPAKGASQAAAVNKPVDVGNTICPVSGEMVDAMEKATYVYEGKIYNFCCPSCIDTFKKDPQKYIKKIEQQKAAATKAQPMDMQHHH